MCCLFPWLIDKDCWVHCFPLAQGSGFRSPKIPPQLVVPRGPWVWPTDPVGKWAWHVGNRMSHGGDFTIALILNSVQRKCSWVPTETVSQGWARLWLSDVSILYRKLAFLAPVIINLARNLLERCWYLVDLFFFPAAHEKQTQKSVLFSPFPFENLFWNSLSFLRLQNALRWSAKCSLLGAMARWLWPRIRGKTNWGSVPVGVMKTS